MVGKSPAADVTTREAAVGESSKEPAGKDPDVTVTAGETVASVLSQRRVVSSTVHDVHQSKEPTGMMYLSYSCK